MIGHDKAQPLRIDVEERPHLKIAIRKNRIFQCIAEDNAARRALTSGDPFRHAACRIKIRRQIKALPEVCPSPPAFRIRRRKLRIRSMVEVDHTSVPPRARQQSRMSSISSPSGNVLLGS